VFLEFVVATPNLHTRALSSTFLILDYAVLRCKHGQRARLVETGPWFGILEIPKGKVKRGGVRKKELIGFPRCLVSGIDLCAIIAQLQAKFDSLVEGEAVLGSLLPDFTPRGARLSEVEGIACKPMRMNRALGFLSDICSGEPLALDKASCDVLRGHGPRHTLPFLAEKLALEEVEKLKIGDWSRARQRALGQPLVSTKMPDLYAGQRELAITQARIKGKVVKALQMAIERLTNNGIREVVANIGKYRNIRWDHLLHCWPSTEEAEQEFLSASRGAVASEVFRALPQPTEESEEASATSDDAKASTSSDESVAPLEPVQVEWLLSRGSGGRLHLQGDPTKSEYGRATACNRVLTRPEYGKSLQDALAADAKWSPRCWAMLSSKSHDLGPALIIRSDPYQTWLTPCFGLRVLAVGGASIQMVVWRA